MTAVRLSVDLDAAQVLADLSALADLAEAAPEVGRRLVDLMADLPMDGVFELDEAVARAGETRIRLQLAPPLREFLAAVRAGDVDPGVVGESRVRPSRVAVVCGSSLLPRAGADTRKPADRNEP